MCQALCMDYYFICLEQSLGKETTDITISGYGLLASMPSDSSASSVDTLLHLLLTNSGFPFPRLNSSKGCSLWRRTSKLIRSWAICLVSVTCYLSVQCIVGAYSVPGTIIKGKKTGPCLPLISAQSRRGMGRGRSRNSSFKYNVVRCHARHMPRVTWEHRRGSLGQ